MCGPGSFSSVLTHKALDLLIGGFVVSQGSRQAGFAVRAMGDNQATEEKAATKNRPGETSKRADRLLDWSLIGGIVNFRHSQDYPLEKQHQNLLAAARGHSC
jgi:hypothetical protein